MIGHLISISYLIAVVLFIVGMRWMGHPDTARKGNLTALYGMVLAILAASVEDARG